MGIIVYVSIKKNPAICRVQFFDERRVAKSLRDVSRNYSHFGTLSGNPKILATSRHNEAQTPLIENFKISVVFVASKKIPANEAARKIQSQEHASAPVAHRSIELA